MVALLWPLFSPGQLALRDMLVLDQPALTPSALGWGDLPARNAPQDGLLGLIGMAIPASWAARALIVFGALAGAGGAIWLSRVVGGGLVGTLAAVTIVLWNPFVVERLLQGHWSLVIAGWLLPLIAAAGLSGRTWVMWLGMWAASLTPTGAILALLTGVIVSRARRGWTLAIGVLACLPWIIPGLTNPASGLSTSASISAFAPRAEAHVGTLGALLGLGGIWNADAVPASRETGGFALAGILLFAVLMLGVRRVPLPLLGLAALGIGGAVFVWLAPGAMGWVVETIPGTGLFRDAGKLVVLALPAYAALAASLRPSLAAVALALALLQIPDAPSALQQLAPTQLEVDEELVSLANGRDVLLVDTPTLTLRPDGLPILDPHAKALSLVESGVLVVDGVVVDPPSERWVQANQAWTERDLAKLADLEVGAIVDNDQFTETTAESRSVRTGLFLLIGWLLIPVALLTARWLRRHR
ncbi:hypothetical protein [Corynebacterium alimapuense]|uniref:Glycosyltransferase RgtA/B/C/D-like domain-containing protein n=1 Tax=Corynebacterium alimapuense TaxID=1576874 RepID=A0A3M8K9Z9_9CORY|nr:hypothetical protein [Corynebacterium alimapuense]RNE49976.1 hypothetical protein C5L39_00970 [Corynebacterium alimapuense]